MKTKKQTIADKAKLWDAHQAKTMAADDALIAEYQARADAYKALEEADQAKRNAALERERLANAPQLLFEELCESISNPEEPWVIKNSPQHGLVIIHENSGVWACVSGNRLIDKRPFFQRRKLKRVIVNRSSYNTLNALLNIGGAK